MPSATSEFDEGTAYVRRKHQVVPVDLGFDPPSQAFQPGGVLGAYGATQVLGSDQSVSQLGRGNCCAAGPAGPSGR
jgi:hypothetical protein